MSEQSNDTQPNPEPIEAAPAAAAEATETTETQETTEVTEVQETKEATEPTTENKSAEANEANEADAEKAAKAAEDKARQARVAPLYRAFRAKRSIQGRIEAVIKGGFEIRVGKVRAFCPHSQIDTQRVEDAESFVGKTLPFRITQLRRGGDDVVVSRRQLIEDERREEAGAVRATLIEGAVMLGRVSGLAKFGAFVDLGAGVTGLVHITELSHGRVAKPEQAVQVGEAVRVKILKLEDDNKRVSLSIRQASEDPWSSAGDTFAAGSQYPGKVLRLADFGAFVELAPGVEALAPASEFPPARLGWAEALPVGSEHQWQVLNVDAKRRRISVTLPFEGEALPETLEVGSHVKGKVQRIERYGVFVWLGPGKVGLMPNALTGTRPGTDLGREFPVANEIEVEIVAVDDNGRIRLGVRGAAEAAAKRQADRRPRSDRPRRRKERLPEGPPASDSSEGFGSQLADKLKDALG